MVIDKIEGKKKRADIDAIHNFIVQADATNIDKNTIKGFVIQQKLVAQKLVIQKTRPKVMNHIIKHQQMKIYLNRVDTP